MDPAAAAALRTGVVRQGRRCVRRTRPAYPVLPPQKEEPEASQELPTHARFIVPMVEQSTHFIVFVGRRTVRMVMSTDVVEIGALCYERDFECDDRHQEPG